VPEVVPEAFFVPDDFFVPARAPAFFAAAFVAAVEVLFDAVEGFLVPAFLAVVDAVFARAFFAPLAAVFDGTPPAGPTGRSPPSPADAAASAASAVAGSVSSGVPIGGCSSAGVTTAS
jgi:hypothetical protein